MATTYTPDIIRATIADFFMRCEKNGSKIYFDRVAEMSVDNKQSVVIDFQDVQAFDVDLAVALLTDPNRTLEAFRAEVFEMVSGDDALFVKSLRNKTIVRINNISDVTPIRSVNVSLMGRLFAVAGAVIRVSERKNLAKIAAFTCAAGHVTHVTQTDEKLKMPEHCEERICVLKNFEFDKERSVFADYQKIRIQEMNEDLPSGQLPRGFDVILTDDLIDTARPGDHVVVTGMLRPIQDKMIGSAKSTIFVSEIDCNYVEIRDKSAESTKTTKEDIIEIKHIAERPDAYQQLIASIAPAILGYERIKESVLLQLAGGVPMIFPDGTKRRGDIHLLICGDPGTAKTEILQFASKAATRGITASGKGSSSVGLSAGIVKEKDTMYLEAGAMPLADQGLLALDETDKMRSEDRSAMHEMMESQSYHGETEILLSNGSKITIGEFVDNLFISNKADIVRGIKCEILPLQDGHMIDSFEFKTNQVTRAKIARVSRHVAPEKFFKITYSNGRSVIVTPEHPVYVYQNGQVREVDASDVMEGMMVPAPRLLPSDQHEIELRDVKGRKKSLRFPNKLNSELGRILGYLTAEGYTYIGNSERGNPYYEVGFSNTDKDIVEDFKKLMVSQFNFTPTISIRPPNLTPIKRKIGNRVRIVRSVLEQTILRYSSKEFYYWYKTNFVGLVTTARYKRIPEQVFGSPTSVIREFLSGAFLGDGGIETTNLFYSTSSEGLVEDYQDLLLKIGIGSIKTCQNDEGGLPSYRAVICGDSKRRFLDLVVKPIDKRLVSIQKLCSTNQSYGNGDVMPTTAIMTLTQISKTFRMPLGHINSDIRNKTNMNRMKFIDYLVKFQTKMNEIRVALEQEDFSLKGFRAKTGLSQAALGKMIGWETWKVAAVELGWYKSTSKQLMAEMRMKIHVCINNTELQITQLETLSKLRFLNIRSVEMIPNVKEKYVYDVTVEPSHTFISHGLILHNTFTLNKAGFHMVLNTRTSVLAALNPMDGVYDTTVSFMDNVRLPAPLISRFDLITIILDRPSPANDAAIAKHILSEHIKNSYETPPPLPLILLKKYIAYVKLHVKPKFTQDAATVLEEYYSQLRRQSEPGKVPITARALESLIRISTARAKILLHDEVTTDDAKVAIDLMARMFKEVFTDMKTGEINTGELAGISKKDGQQKTAIQALSTLGMSAPGGLIEKDALLYEMKDRGLNEETAEKMIKVMMSEGRIMETQRGVFKIINSFR